MDKRDLLGQLKIDRDGEASPRPAKPVKWLLAIAVLGGLGFVGWFVAVPVPSALPVRTAVAAAPAANLPRDSVLDATGYVVARRQATVSAKVTGKVEQVLTRARSRRWKALPP